ncbi:hypothetical protein N7537_009292 [Penicillium hordei]|uniref:Rhodopsin domain-containing protein n=1 Tax=Penicillium hordei TaxID=40994 RepID=A0AAD6DSK6_9EURO|nr:uncharacterized protein N7537_009292 [Penicillium hordei]KAJ5592388.1 hypothetical protein N7537_009292 [Penicillium hordei]
MSLSPLGEPPAGTNLNADHGKLNYAPVIATYSLAVITVGLRFYTRFRVQTVKIGADDWVIAAALLPATAGLVLLVRANAYNGLGKHVWSIPPNEVVEMMRILFIFILFYVLTTPLVKLSILLFYRRIFVSYYWTQFAEPSGGRCVFKIYPFLVTQATVNMATDVLILVVPIPILWNLQMRRPQKILLSGIFLVGGIVCIASFIRIYYITFLKTPYDYTWVIGNFYLWSSIEPSIGILCACLPTLYPLLRSIVARISGNSLRRYSEALRNQDTASKRIYIGRQRPLDWDETLLTTHDVQVEMSGTRRDNAQDRHITVDTEFRIVEESNQLK